MVVNPGDIRQAGTDGKHKGSIVEVAPHSFTLCLLHVAVGFAIEKVGGEIARCAERWMQQVGAILKYGVKRAILRLTTRIRRPLI